MQEYLQRMGAVLAEMEVELRQQVRQRCVLFVAVLRSAAPFERRHQRASTCLPAARAGPAITKSPPHRHRALRRGARAWRARRRCITSARRAARCRQTTPATPPAPPAALVPAAAQPPARARPQGAQSAARACVRAARQLPRRQWHPSRCSRSCGGLQARCQGASHSRCPGARAAASGSRPAGRPPGPRPRPHGIGSARASRRRSGPWPACAARCRGSGARRARVVLTKARPRAGAAAQRRHSRQRRHSNAPGAMTRQRVAGPAIAPAAVQRLGPGLHLPPRALRAAAQPLLAATQAPTALQRPHVGGGFALTPRRMRRQARCSCSRLGRGRP
jgi:hypothetical protein